MSHPKKGTEAYERERQRDRERKARKRAEKRLAMQAEIKKAPESAMQSKEPEPDMWTPFMVQLRRQQREHSK
jgi:hypothetical protein